jgi:hypothetical protein
MRSARNQMGNVGSGSGVAGSRLDLAPGKRTLTEGLQPVPRIEGGEVRAAGPGGALLGPTRNSTALPPTLGTGSGPAEAVRRGAWPWQAPDHERTTMRADARLPVIGDVETQCVGEDFARDLSDGELEQTIEYLIQRRDRTDLDPVDREVAISNLAVLSAESARRGRSSGALDRDAVRTLIRDATAGAQELAGILRQLAGNRDGLRNHPLTERFLEHAIDRLI